MKYYEALREAEEMIDYLRPACLGHGTREEAIAIVGSLRRKAREEYNEIDLIMIPDLTPPPLPRAVFGGPVPKIHKTKLDELIFLLQDDEKIHLTGSGPRSKKFLSLHCELSFDISVILPPATWGVLQLIRTGPSEFSHWVVTRRSGRAYSPLFGPVTGGALPDGYRVQGGAVFEGEKKIPDKELLKISPIGFETEEGFLDWLGLGWIDPGDRAAKWGRSRS